MTGASGSTEVAQAFGRASVNTRKAPRRALRFAGLDDLIAELDRIQQAHDAGSLRTTGNWTAGQILGHLAAFWQAAIDGFPPEMAPPWAVRVAARLLFRRKAISGATTPAGFKPPRAARAHMEFGPETTFEAGMSSLRAQIERTRRGERFAKPSPLLGELTHDEWLRLQLGHCQLHLGFVEIAGA